MITTQTTKRAAKILAEQKREYERKFQGAKGDSKAIARVAAEYRSEYGKTPLKRWHNALSQAAKETASHSAPVRKTSKPATKTAAAPKASKPVTKKAPTIKPLGGFVLTKTGKLCTTQEVVSKWGSDNIKSWKRIYLVRLYDDDKTASISGRFVICLKNGQYYFGDMWGQAAIDFNRNMAEEWEKFIHPQGAKKPAVRRVGLNYSEYAFRDQNEAFAFAEYTHKRKVESNMQGVDSKAFNMLLKDMYEMEYHYAQFPNRRGKPYAAINWYEKPQKVNTTTQSNATIDKREVQMQARKLGVIEGHGQSVHFTAKLKDLVELYHGHKQEVLNIVCDMWADDTIRRRGGGRVELYKEEAQKEARRIFANRKSQKS